MHPLSGKLRGFDCVDVIADDHLHNESPGEYRIMWKKITVIAVLGKNQIGEQYPARGVVPDARQPEVDHRPKAGRCASGSGGNRSWGGRPVSRRDSEVCDFSCVTRGRCSSAGLGF